MIRIIIIIYFLILVTISCTTNTKMFIGNITNTVGIIDNTFYNQTKQISQIIKDFTNDTNLNLRYNIKIDNRTRLLYSQNKFQPLWYSLEQRAEGLALLKSSKNHGLLPNDYSVNIIEELIKNDTVFSAKNNATIDIFFTNGVLQYSKHLFNGRVNPKELNTEWNYNINLKSNQDSIILEFIKNCKISDIEIFFEHKTLLYKNLKAELYKYRHVNKDAFIPLSYPNILLKEGDSNMHVLKLKKHLIELDYLNSNSKSSLFDDKLTKLLKQFQKTHGLTPDGIPGKNTYYYLSWPTQKYIDIIRVNMERCRWIPDLSNNTYLTVNIPEYKLRLYKNNKELFFSKVIVGKVKNKTPVFTSEIEYLVFNPCWTVPYSIATKKLLPKIKKDSTYLDRNNMFVGIGGTEIDSDSVNFINYSENNFPFKIYQRSCSSNALGVVKFIFPNKYQVFLHDTPNKKLFNKEWRAFSSGCIRLQNPLTLAEIILNDIDNNNTSISKYLSKNYPFIVELKKIISINITYFTCVYNNDNIQYFNDIYGRDYKILKELGVSN